MKLKKCQEKAILLYLRDALIQERCKSYYRKNTNIQEKFILSKEMVPLYGMDYWLIQECIVYQNGMVDFVQYTIPDYRKKDFGKKKIKMLDFSTK